MERFAMLEHVHGKPEATQRLIRCTPQRFSQWAERHRGTTLSLYDDFDFDESDDDNLDAFFSRRITKPQKSEGDDANRTDLFLPEYIITCGVPEIQNAPEEPGMKAPHTTLDAEMDVFIQGYSS